MRLDLELFPFSPFADRVWALREKLTSHDAWHVALAEALQCPLVTLDRRLGRASGPSCEIVAGPRDVASGPGTGQPAVEVEAPGTVLKR